MDIKEKTELSKILASAYATSSILRSEKAIDNQVELLLGWLDKFSASSKPMQLSEFFTFAAYDIMGEFMLFYRGQWRGAPIRLVSLKPLLKC